MVFGRSCSRSAARQNDVNSMLHHGCVMCEVQRQTFTQCSTTYPDYTICSIRTRQKRQKNACSMYDLAYKQLLLTYLEIYIYIYMLATSILHERPLLHGVAWQATSISSIKAGEHMSYRCVMYARLWLATGFGARDGMHASTIINNEPNGGFCAVCCCWGWCWVVECRCWCVWCWEVVVSSDNK